MFEEICLACGKQLNDDGRAYCSDDCQHTEFSSPSISSSSSVLSSPNMGYAPGGEVPSLMPSALGSALKKYVSQSGRYVSSSSASSTSWSVVTDEEDKETAHRYGVDEFPYYEPSDPLYSEAYSKSPNPVYSINSAALSYARRPSGTNNPSTVPHTHRPLFSGPPSLHVRGIPRSAPLSHAHIDDDEGYSDVGSSSGDALDLDDADLNSEQDCAVASAAKPKHILPSKPNRARNRVSLPACFSLLKISSPRRDFKSSPVSSPNNTTARPSPPTPKIPSSNGLSQVLIGPCAPLTSVHTTPRGRGRGRETDKSRSSRRSGYSSPSWSPSHSRCAPAGGSPTQVDEEKHEADIDYRAITSIPLRRGREATRRNSSPPAKMLIGVDPNLMFAPGKGTQEGDRTRSGSDSRPRTRGRARVEDLGGLGLSSDAPGYGFGRSGLVDRKRERGTGSYIARVPL